MTKEEQRRLIAEATDRFLASKGEIKIIPASFEYDSLIWAGCSEREIRERALQQRPDLEMDDYSDTSSAEVLLSDREGFTLVGESLDDDLDQIGKEYDID